MTQIVVVLLTLPDGRVVLQWRSNDAPISAGKLGFFGGHVEPNETPDAAMRREIGEETSLNVNILPLKYVRDFRLSAKITGNETVHFYLYQAAIRCSDFAVYEGDGAEVYDINEALARDDITSSTRNVLAAIKEN